jgi:hypothetical protein
MLEYVQSLCYLARERCSEARKQKTIYKKEGDVDVAMEWRKICQKNGRETEHELYDMSKVLE